MQGLSCMFGENCAKIAEWESNLMGLLGDLLQSTLKLGTERNCVRLPVMRQEPISGALHCVLWIYSDC